MGAVDISWLNFHYGGYLGPYKFARENGKYVARAQFRAHDVLEADTPVELLTKVRRHYPGTRADSCST